MFNLSLSYEVDRPGYPALIEVSLVDTDYHWLSPCIQDHMVDGYNVLPTWQFLFEKVCHPTFFMIKAHMIYGDLRFQDLRPYYPASFSFFTSSSEFLESSL